MPDELTDAWIAAADLVLAEMPLGSLVRVLGGFENGIEGRLVGARFRVGDPSRPVFFVAADTWIVESLCGSDVVLSGIGAECLEAVADPEPFGEFGEPDADGNVRLYVMECYGCGTFGTNHVFGLGRARRCPNCHSYEVHSR